MDDEAWTRWLAEPLRGRKVIIGYRVVAGATRAIADLRRWGARRPLLISVGRGTGAIPPADSYLLHTMQVHYPDTMTAEVRRAIAWSADPPQDVVGAVENYDPDGEAVWWNTPFSGDQPSLGRTVFGGRPRAWSALEDKLLCDEIWDAAGVRRAPSRVVAVDDDALRIAAEQVDRGSGTVWAGDARDGLNGGNDFVRWVRDPAQHLDAVEFFTPRCDRVRVMPFLDGIACSIHGFVLPDGVAAFRPVELVQSPDPESGTFGYGGISTWWDPETEVRESMRTAARSVGRVLADRVGYRGGFGIDGVATGDGFLPTELNPRFSGGLATLSRALPELPLELVQLNAALGRDVRMPAYALERRIVRAADDRRGGRVMVHVGRDDLRESSEHPVVWDGRDLAAAVDAEPDAIVNLGPSVVSGGLAMLELREPVIRPGRSAVPHAAALRRFATRIPGRVCR